MMAKRTKKKCKERWQTSTRQYPQIFLDRLRTTMKISVGVFGVTAKIQTGNVQNTSQKRKGLSHLAQNLVWQKIINSSMMSWIPHK